MNRFRMILRDRTRTRILAKLALVVALVAPLTGCIRSRVTITSEPAGAEVFWRGERRGPTPITIPFEWYWHYDYRLEKEGFEPVEVVDRFRTPPWFLMPLDLLMELVPVPIPDNRRRHYVLKPAERTPEGSEGAEPSFAEGAPGAASDASGASIPASEAPAVPSAVSSPSPAPSAPAP